MDGSLYYTPAATKWCLLDFTDFPAGTSITVPIQHDFRVGDPVKFTAENGGVIDSAFTTASADLEFFVVAVSATTISVSATKGGTPVTSGGKGGTGSANTAGHINVQYDPFGAVCQITNWELTIERENLDVTTLPCGVGAKGAVANKYAAFRKTQPGYASGTGSLNVVFTDNDDALGQRMLDNVLLSSQEGARVRLFMNTIADAQNTGVDLTASMYIEADISMSSMQVNLNAEEAITADIGFSVSNVSHLFKTAIT